MANLSNIRRLKDIIANNPHCLPYANFSVTDTTCSYAGWISNFNIYKRNDTDHANPYSLNLNNDNDLFLLFVLASAWSRSGPYENALYYILYIHENGLESPTCWENEAIVAERCDNRETDAREIFHEYDDISRKEIYFRPDFYSGTHILARKWGEIKGSLTDSEEKNDYSIFVRKIREIKGIGGSDASKSMAIKIPLVLRELRVANRFKNIPGEWCCIPDSRVLDCCKDPFFDIKLSNRGSFIVDSYSFNNDNVIIGILKKSETIYRLFGDLYDIPLFAYKDLHEMRLI